MDNETVSRSRKVKKGDDILRFENDLDCFDYCNKEKKLCSNAVTTDSDANGDPVDEDEDCKDWDIDLMKEDRDVDDETTDKEGDRKLWDTMSSQLEDKSETPKLKTIDFIMKNKFFKKLRSTPIDYFSYFFDEELLSMICSETNSHATDVLEGDISDQPVIDAWKELSVPELRTFLGLMFHMGTISLYRMTDYWRSTKMFDIPVFQKHMSRNRFYHIMSCLYFSSKTKNEEALFEIQSIIQYFNKKMNECYYPAKELTIEESINLRDGQLYFGQETTQKGDIRLYSLAEPDGLILRCHVNANPESVQDIVLYLMGDKLHRGHSLYLGKYYNSIHLAKLLLDNDTYCTGTLRRHLKEIPKEVADKTLHKGENMSLFKDGVHMGKWRGMRTIMYVTTEFAGQGNKKIRLKPFARLEAAGKPEAIIKYDQLLGTMQERWARLLAFYPLQIKPFRWYLKLAILIFHLLLINSWKMYNKYSRGRKMGLYEYRLSVLSSLLSAPNTKRKRSRTKVTTHRISKILEKTSNGRRLKRRQCRWCAKAKRRKEITYICLDCEGSPALCFDCFHPYHENL